MINLYLIPCKDHGNFIKLDCKIRVGILRVIFEEEKDVMDGARSQVQCKLVQARV